MKRYRAAIGSYLSDPCTLQPLQGFSGRGVLTLALPKNMFVCCSLIFSGQYSVSKISGMSTILGWARTNTLHPTFSYAHSFSIKSQVKSYIYLLILIRYLRNRHIITQCSKKLFEVYVTK